MRSFEQIMQEGVDEALSPLGSIDLDPADLLSDDAIATPLTEDESSVLDSFGLEDSDFLALGIGGPDEDAFDFEMTTFSDESPSADTSEEDEFGTLPEKEGRRAMAGKVRRIVQGRPLRSEAYGCGYAEGYAAAMQASGRSPDEAKAIYGGLIRLAKKEMVSLGQDVDRWLKSKPLGKAHDLHAEGGDPAEAEKSELPPVYVSDPVGFHEDMADAMGEHESHGGLVVADRFGAVAKQGAIGRQVRRPAGVAMARSLQKGAKALSVGGVGSPQPFVHDADATPVLYRSGAVKEPIYGDLVPVPCPSCTQVSSPEQCGVCDAFGAVLVPETDVPDWCATRYGFLFAIPLIATAIAKSKKKKKDKEDKAIADAIAAHDAAASSSSPAATVTASTPVPASVSSSGGQATPQGSFTPSSPSTSSDSDTEADLASLETMGCVRAIVPRR